MSARDGADARPAPDDPARRAGTDAVLDVLYNATFARVGGGLSYVINQIRSLGAAPDLHLTVLAGPDNHGALQPVCEEIGAGCRLVRTPSVPLRWAWEQLVLPVVARRHDVLVCPGNFSPLLARTPTLLVLQTAALVGSGRSYGAGPGKTVRVHLSHLSMRTADEVVVISEPLAAEVRAEPALRSVEPIVIRSGVPPVHPRTQVDVTADRAVAERIAGPHPYLLSVAHDYAHKRLDDLGLLAARLGPPADTTEGARAVDTCAAHAAPAAGPVADGDPEDSDDPAAALAALRIVVVGEVSDDRRHEILDLAGHGAARLRFVGACSDADTVRALYATATVAISTSALEAWNFSLHEATSQGTPMVATDLPAHRELGGDHVTYYPVGDLDAMIAALAAAVRRTDRTPWVPGWTWSDHGTELARHLRRLALARTAP